MAVKKAASHPVNVITVAGLVATPSEEPMYRSYGEKVEWTCDAGNFAVIFKSGSATARTGHAAHQGGTISSTVDAAKGTYDYAIAVVTPAGIATADPHIIIQ